MRNIWEKAKFILFAVALSWSILQQTWVPQPKQSPQQTPTISAQITSPIKRVKIVLPTTQPITKPAKKNDGGCQALIQQAYRVKGRTNSKNNRPVSCI